MLAQSVALVKDELDRFFRQVFDLNESTVSINTLAKPDGSPLLENQNKLVITLINICQETNKQFYGSVKRVNNQATAVRPAQMFNIDLLFTSQFDDYLEALKFINATMTFFQANPTLRKPAGSDPDNLESHLEFEVYNIDLRETYSLWNSMGAKYAPSIVYKMKYVIVDGQKTIEVLQDVKQVEVDLSAQ